MKTTDQIWDKILSRDCRLIQETFNELERGIQKAIINHLQKMITENGWHLEQIKSAQIALGCIQRDVKE